MARRDPAILNELVYLDSASVSPPLISTIQAMVDYYNHFPFNYRVGQWQRALELKESVERAREKVARFVGTSSGREIIFTKNTTEAINIVAQGYRWKRGDEVIITNIEHQSNILPWLRVSNSYGVKVKFARADELGIVQVENLEGLITKKTRLISITEVSNVFGSIQPIRELVKLGLDNGIPVMTDAAQSAGRMQVDVVSSGTTFAAFCGRKSIMGPQGTGFLFGKREALNQLTPLSIGSLGAQARSEDSFDYMQLPYRFEAGVINTAGIIGLASAIESLQRVRIQQIRSKIKRLTKKLMDCLKEINGIEIYGPTDFDKQSGIVSWNLRKFRSDEVAVRLWKIGRIAVASGDQGAPLATASLRSKTVVRTSVHYFNNENDIDALIAALKQINYKVS